MRRVLKWTGRLLLLVILVAFGWGLVAYWRSTNDCDRKTVMINPMKAIRYCECNLDQGHARGKLVVTIE